MIHHPMLPQAACAVYFGQGAALLLEVPTHTNASVSGQTMRPLLFGLDDYYCSAKSGGLLLPGALEPGGLRLHVVWSAAGADHWNPTREITERSYNMRKGCTLSEHDVP